MKIFNSTTIPKIYKGAAIAIGNFDGIHKGHQKVFKKTKQFANIKKIKFGVMTFSPLPIMFFNKKIKNHRLVSENHKMKLFKKHGVDFVINVNFNKKFSKTTANDFVRNIIFKKINPKSLSVSNNFKFGRNRKGNVALLTKLGIKYNYRLLNIKPFKYNGNIVSSTRIRKCLQTGKINFANKLLSRTWFIDGLVQKGKRLGRKLGYRTCNISIKNYIYPKIGIHAVKIMIGNKNKIYGGVAYLGSRPTFKGKEVFLETNIFGINKNLYNKRLKVYFQKFIRGDKKFKNPAKLIKQINKDVILAKKGLKTKLVL